MSVWLVLFSLRIFYEFYLTESTAQLSVSSSALFPPHTMSSSTAWRHISFEVHGKVQKVYFRKYTQDEATKLGLLGWVKNLDNGTTVKGEAVGPKEAIEKFKHWLAHVGSPSSKIDKADFLHDNPISEEDGKKNFQSFDIQRKPKKKD